MRVPLSWLRDFAPFGGDAVALGETLDDLGMVVEGVERVGEGLESVVVARVLDVRPHPDADRVRLVDVDAGDGEPKQIACGADNVAAGQLVPLATVGAVLPGGLEIARRKVRGQWSDGMICSAHELRVGEDRDGIMVLPDAVEVGAPFAEAMGIGTDVVFDLAIEGNRPDAMSIAGVARDAAARLGLPFSVPEPRPVAAERTVEAFVPTTVLAPDLCARFVSQPLTDVTVGPSPPWLVRRLTLAGMRPIANVVDVSNYVMLELGQPTHPYDLDRLAGHGLLVRRAREGETLRTLDGVERRLGDGDDCLICDAEVAPVGIAGIMGGASSEISEATTTVLLEAAWFAPMAIARTSKRLGLRSEASARFERGVDHEGVERAVARIVELLADVSGAHAARGSHYADEEHLPPSRRVLVRTERVNALLGTDLADADVASYLAPIGFAVTATGPGRHEVTVPAFRPDVTAEVDVVEEVARHHGYGRVLRTVPRSRAVGRLTPYQLHRRKLRDVLAGAGVSEAVCPPLVGPGDHERAGLAGDVIAAVDPLNREESVLRASLLPGLLKAVAYNASHRSPDVSLFEIGHVFSAPLDRTAPLPDEREKLGVVLAGPDDPGGAGALHAKQVLDVVLAGVGRRDTSLEPVTGPGLHPTRTARILLGADVVGHVGEVDPAVVEAFGLTGRVGWIDVDLESLLPATRTYVQARPVSKLPSSDVDLAFVVDDAVPASALACTLREAAGDLLVDLRLFDVFRDARLGEERRSLAYRLRLQAPDRTLTDAEVAEVRDRCIAAVARAHGGELRG